MKIYNLYKITLMLCLLFQVVSVQAQESKNSLVNFKIKNQNTGMSIAGAVIKVHTPSGILFSVSADEFGKAAIPMKQEDGEYRYTIIAEGYDILETYFNSEISDSIEAEIDLDPIEEKATNNTSTFEQKSSLNTAIISGYLINETTGLPISGVQVTTGTFVSQTDVNGVFTLMIPATPVVQEKTPERTDLKFSKAGFRTLVKKDLFFTTDKYTLKVSLEPQLKSVKGKANKSTVKSQNHGIFDRVESDYSYQLAAVGMDDISELGAKNTSAINIPTSIRVGINCSCVNCSTVRVMSLEAYTESGLDDEWIASWRSNSLKAGAVAYRSYGAWYVLNPVSSRYDIAATTCNQVWDNSIAESARSAARATAGRVLLKNGKIFRSEYSAENNNAGCGDGFSGTSSGWPCISDPRDKGQAKFGHGRGMCQWGSQRWSSDKDYLWILDHYYTPGNVFVSGDNCESTLTFTGVIKSGTYKSSNTITASGTIATTRNVVFDTKGAINLKPGFVAKEGASFTARIGNGCSGSKEAVTELLDISAITNLKERVILYPNPANQSVFLQIEILENTSLSYQIYDIAGKNIMHNQYVFDKNSRMKQLIIKTEHIPEGIYFCKIQSGTETITKKLQITHN